MLYLRSTTLWVVTTTPIGRVVDAFSVPWNDGAVGREALKLAEGAADMALQRRKKITEAGLGRLRVKPCALAKAHPDLWEFLTLTEWKKGEPREPGTMFIILQEGILKCCLGDRDNDEVMWVAGESLEQLLGVLEAALGDPQADWRIDRKARERKREARPKKKVDRG
jgi:hypothetical protein